MSRDTSTGCLSIERNEMCWFRLVSRQHDTRNTNRRSAVELNALRARHRVEIIVIERSTKFLLETWRVATSPPLLQRFTISNYNDCTRYTSFAERRGERASFCSCWLDDDVSRFWERSGGERRERRERIERGTQDSSFSFVQSALESSIVPAVQTIRAPVDPGQGGAIRGWYIFKTISPSRRETPVDDLTPSFER